MTRNAISLCLSLAIFLLAGCDYGVNVDGEGGVDMRMPGQSMKISREGGVEIDQGVQKMRVGKDGVDIQQPGQRVRLTNDDGVQIHRSSETRVENEKVELDTPRPQLLENETAQIVRKPVEATTSAKVDHQPRGRDDEPAARPDEPARPAPAAQDVTVSRSGLRVFGEVPRGQKNFAGQRVVQKSLAERDLRDADFSNAHIIQSDFRGCDLTGANFAGANISQCSFEDAKLLNANLAGASITQGWYSGADFSGANFGDARLIQTDFRASNLTMTNFNNATETQVKKP